jgi:hypothetical protein
VVSFWTVIQIYAWWFGALNFGNFGQDHSAMFWHIAGCGLAVSIQIGLTSSSSQGLSFLPIYIKSCCLWGRWWEFHVLIEHLRPISFETDNLGQGAIQTERT